MIKSDVPSSFEARTNNKGISIIGMSVLDTSHRRAREGDLQGCSIEGSLGVYLARSEV